MQHFSLDSARCRLCRRVRSSSHFSRVLPMLAVLLDEAVSVTLIVQGARQLQLRVAIRRDFDEAEVVFESGRRPNRPGKRFGGLVAHQGAWLGVLPLLAASKDHEALVHLFDGRVFLFGRVAVEGRRRQSIAKVDSRVLF